MSCAVAFPSDTLARLAAVAGVPGLSLDISSWNNLSHLALVSTLSLPLTIPASSWDIPRRLKTFLIFAAVIPPFGILARLFTVAGVPDLSLPISSWKSLSHSALVFILSFTIPASS